MGTLGAPTSTILVVDDDESARQTIEALLISERYDMLFAESADASLEVLARRRVDLVLCDIMMPNISGFEVCRAIKTHPEWRLTPVVLLTALDGADDQVRGLDAGADDFLSKPLSGTILRARVRAMLRVRHQYIAGDELLRVRRAEKIRAAELTAREVEVLDLVLLGRAHEDIALALGISERTSKFHQANILRKLGAESRYDLLRLFT